MNGIDWDSREHWLDLSDSRELGELGYSLSKGSRADLRLRSS